MTPEEHLAQVAANPRAYYQALGERSAEFARGYANNLNSRVAKIFQDQAEILIKHIQELTIFRALEAEFRLDIVTPDSLKQYMQELSDFRNEIKAKAEAVLAQQGKPQV